jgi:hypothetical protein
LVLRPLKDISIPFLAEMMEMMEMEVVEVVKEMEAQIEVFVDAQLVTVQRVLAQVLVCGRRHTAITE